MASFAFIPRKLAKRHVGPVGRVDQSAPRNIESSSVPDEDSHSSLPNGPHGRMESSLNSMDLQYKGKQKEQNISDTEYASLIYMSLSDHTLWLDKDLRQAVESSNERCACHAMLSVRYSQSKFIQLSHLAVF
jgi:hypothetical protein